MERADLPDLPSTPGIYQYLDADGTILYIGKAKNLHTRVRSYFSSTQSTKTQRMLSEAAQVDTLTTRTEVEALLLENQLIREHKPKYNILLRDNRRYAWILVTDEEYPRIITARNKKRNGEYFGPYTDGTARRKIIMGLNKLFKLRTCTTMPKKVCLQYHIKNCAGPCEGHISKEDYLERVQDATDVLRGHTKEVRERLQKRMYAASEDKDYEQAKQMRDMIRSLEELEHKQVVEKETHYDQDVVAYATDEEEAAFAVVHVRHGVIREKDEFSVPARSGVVEEFLSAYYRERTPPKEIITHDLDEDSRQALEEYFSQRSPSSVAVTVPQRGDKKKLLALAAQNAQLTLDQENKALQSLERHLNLSSVPVTIDCFDVSNIQGTHIVAACVRYRNAKPEPTKYRRFKIRDTDEQDDYAAMAEAVRRRYKDGDVPDLIVIDGGKGQLSAARKALEEHGINNPIISLAKQEEEVFVPGLPHSLPIKQKDPGLLLLRRIRDSAHRFVINYHRKKRKDAMTSSALDHIDGIGKKRKQRLYDHFKNFSRIKEASKEELQNVLGKKTGARLHEQLH